MLRYFALCMSLLVSLFFATTGVAAKDEGKGPQIIKIKMGKENIDFTHHKHQKVTDNHCWECHEKNGWKITNWGKATAHKLCIPCHDLNEKGPVNCRGCHRK